MGFFCVGFFECEGSYKDVKTERILVLSIDGLALMMPSMPV